MNNTLKHVAVITDGNGRWATKRGLPRSEGHQAGMSTLDNILKWAYERKIPYVTLYCMSLENRNRDKAEIDYILQLARSVCTDERIAKAKEQGVRMIWAGIRDLMSEEDKALFDRGELETAGGTTMAVAFCVDYGGRREIVDACNAAIAAGEPITEESITNHLYGAVAGMPDVDLIIRTGGYQRLSGFVPWQSVYAELYFTPTLFPDFAEAEFDGAIAWFAAIERTHGGQRKSTPTPISGDRPVDKPVSPFAVKRGAP